MGEVNLMEYSTERAEMLQRAVEIGNNIGAKISSVRREMGLTQEEFGELLGVSAQAVSKWERGGMPDTTLIPSIAQALGITTDELFGMKSHKDPLELSEEEFLNFIYDYAQRLCFPDGEKDKNNEKKFLELLFDTARTLHDGCLFKKGSHDECWEGFNGENKSEKPIPMRLLISDEGNSMVTGSRDFPIIVAVKDDEHLRDMLLGEELIPKFFADFADPDLFRLAVYVQTESRIYSQYTKEFIADMLKLPVNKAEQLCDKLEKYGFWYKEEPIVNTKVCPVYTVGRNTQFRPLLMLIYLMVKRPKVVMNLSQHRMKPML